MSHRRLRSLGATLILAACAACSGPISQLRSGDAARQREGMARLTSAKDEDKAAAIPVLLALSGSDDAAVRDGAYQTLDTLYFSDARLGWRVAATDPALCSRTIEAAQRRWDGLSDTKRDGIFTAIVAGPCPEVEHWAWARVEQSSDTMTRGTALYGWLDYRRDAATTTRMLRLALDARTPAHRVEPISELVAARDLDATSRVQALALVHNPQVSPGARNVLGHRLLEAKPRLDEATLLGVVGGSNAPSELRKSALAALDSAGNPAAFSPATVSRVGAVVVDRASPPDLRTSFASLLAQRPAAEALPALRNVAIDLQAPRDLRGAMTEHLAAYGSPAAATVLATVVRQKDSHPSTRSRALAAMSRAWGPDAEAACVELCADDPFGTLCATALEHLATRSSPRLPQARAHGFSIRIDKAADPPALLAIRSELDDATLASLPAPVQAYVGSLAALAQADATSKAKLGDRWYDIDTAVCTMTEGWEKVNALKAVGKKDEAFAIQRTMYRADHLMREDGVKGRIKAAGRAIVPSVQAAATALAQIGDPALVTRHEKMRSERSGLGSPCIVLPAFDKAQRGVGR